MILRESHDFEWPHPQCVWFWGGGVWFGFFNVRLVIVLVELGEKKREGFA